MATPTSSDMLHISITGKDIVALGCCVMMMSGASLNEKVRVLNKIPCFSHINVAMGCELIFVQHVAMTCKEIIDGEWGADAVELYKKGTAHAVLAMIKEDESQD